MDCEFEITISHNVSLVGDILPDEPKVNLSKTLLSVLLRICSQEKLLRE